MASLSKADSRRMYSWWWNSHISPKNSKWLQENLTDVDVKVKAMIKLIEEDADSFARRAEMYYKKRPELMKLVEELYRAYRALAERYDHATGALRQAHKTMTEAFPNQVPVMCDDPSANSPFDGDPQTPDSRNTPRAFLNPDELQKDLSDLSSSYFSSGKRNGANDEDSTARRGLKFCDSENGDNKQITDKEIVLLKEALAKLEEEKESGLKQYQESLEKLLKLESEISHAQESSREFANRASEAEAEGEKLKEEIMKLESEKEESFELYQKGLEKISNLENALDEKVKEGEKVSESLKEEIARMKEEKDAAYDQYKQLMDAKSELEKKLIETETEVMNLRERVEKADNEVEKLKIVILELTAEKEAQAILYQKCLETISSLELRLACAEEEAKRLNDEIENGVSRLKEAEEQRVMIEKSNEALQTEVKSMILTMGSQTQELTEKQKELGRLWTCIQEERLRFVEAETAFQTLQQLHAQSQEELRSLAGELQTRAQILRDIESRNKVLEEEIHKKIEENKNLNEENLSSSVSLQEMQSEICNLKDSNAKLEEEVELRVDQRNALQQEIYCLKEELNELNKNHQSILEQVSKVGLTPESLSSSVKELQDENCILKEQFEAEKSAKEGLLVKLEIMGQLLERNVVLENSLSDLGAELEGVRSKLKALEESYQSLSEEKSTLAVEKANLLGQLQVTTENLSQVSEKNTVLENSLFDAHVKLEVLKQKSKSFEDSCQLLADEKSTLVNEKGALVSQIEVTEKSLKDLEIKYSDLEEKYSEMEKERESTLRKVKSLHVSLAVQNQEHVAFAEKNEKQLNNMKNQIQLLQEESRNKSKEFEQELDKSFASELEIFVLLNCVQDLEEKNISLFNDYEKLLEASKLSESLVLVLKQEKSKNQVKIKSLSNKNDKLRINMHQLLKICGVSMHDEFGNEQYEACFGNICRKFEENENKNMELFVEVSILLALLKQMKTEALELEAEKCSIQKSVVISGEKILELETVTKNLSKTNEELRLKVSEGDIREKALRTELESLHGELSIVQGALTTLENDNSVVVKEKKCLEKDNLHMKKRICVLEEENDVIFDDVLSQSILSHTLKKYLDEKHVEVNGLTGDLERLHGVNNAITESLLKVEKKFEETRMENLSVKETLDKSERELETVILVREQLNSELVSGKNLLEVKEKEHKELLEKVMIMENEKTELSELSSALQRENNEVKTVKDEQEKQILKLLEDNEYLTQEHACLRETSEALELKVNQLTEDDKRLKQEEESLRSELQNEKEKSLQLETNVSEVYGNFQSSTICQFVLAEKIRELTEVFQTLQEESALKEVNSEFLKEKVNVLESENGDLKAHLSSLKDSIVSLENHACIRTKVPQSETEDEKVDQDAFMELQDLQSKVKAIEIAVVEMQMLTMQEKVDADARLASAMRQIEELSSRRANRSKPRSTSEISEVDIGILPKDIMLDQASECSSYGVSKRGLIDGEIWETADKNGSIDLNVDFNDASSKFNKHHPTASDVSLDTELDKDKVEVSRRFREPREDGNKRKVLERLNSDVQKLTNLQITIEDLKRKVEITGKSRRGKAMIECETLKGQLMEAESAIQKLYELNGKLVKHLETQDKSTTEAGESESMRRKRVSEQARRVSEKIGRLQLEVQKIQFVLLKLDDENDPKGKSRFMDTKKRVLLKDYLYGGGRTKASISSSGRKKKGHFCACVEPSTKGD